MAGEQLVGRTIADGRYEIVRLLGEGGMGAVYQARQVAMDRMVALKLILAELVRSPAAAARFHREMKLTARIEHPNTIRVYDFGETEGQLYLTMELLRGRTLAKALAEAGRLDLPRIVRIATQVTRALSAAHSEGVVHRDLKPDNVMLIEQYGERDIVKVLDFGIAKSLDQEDTGMTSTGAVVGTPAYMSAEQAMGQPVDQRSDLYSLGIMLYEMVSGRVPFRASALTALLVAHATELPVPLGQVAPDVHPALGALVDELLRKDPATRPQSARLVEQRLEALGAAMPFGPPVHAMQPPLQHGPPVHAVPTPAPVQTPQHAPPVHAMQTPLQHGPPVYATPHMHPVHAMPTPPEQLPLPPIAPTHPVARPGKPATSSSRGVWFALVAVVLVGGGIAAVVLGGGGGGSTAPTAAGSGSTGSGAVQPAAGSAATVAPATGAAAARLAAATQKLAGFGDPPPPAACPAAAAADAAEQVLVGRAAIAADPSKALAAADLAIQRCASAAAAHNLRGNALQATGKLDEAGDAYARALQFAPDYEAPRFNLGVIQLRRRDPAAIATFSEVIRRKPDDADGYNSRGQAYFNAERYAEAAADLEQGVARKPDDARAWMLLGAARERGKQGDANQAYCKAADLGIGDAGVRCKR